MPRTAGTRPKGNGPGAGNWASSPAKGEGFRFAPKGDPESDFFRALARDEGHLEEKAEAAAEMLAVLIDVARHDESGAARANAADKALDRLKGKPMVKQDITSKGAQIGYVIPAPAEAEDAEAWQERHKPR